MTLSRNKNHSKDWYLILDDKKEGPYTPDQIHQMFDQGKITVNTRLTNSHLKKQVISVNDLLKARTNPTHTLFEAFETTKNRGGSIPQSSEKLAISTKAIVGLGIFFVLLLILFISLFIYEDPIPDSGEIAEPTANTPIMQKVEKNSPPTTRQQEVRVERVEEGRHPDAIVTHPEIMIHQEGVTEPPAVMPEQNQIEDSEVSVPPPNPDQIEPIEPIAEPVTEQTE